MDAADASVLFTNWGTVPQGAPVADLNDDGQVDAADAAIVFSNWTGDASTHSVPEPTSAVILLLASLGFVCCRRARE